MKLYIAGPMSGITDWNYPAFHDAATRLRAAGYDIINPAEMHAEPVGSLPWHEYLRRGLIEVLSNADGIAVLFGWSNSSGAIAEVNTATSVRMPVKTVEMWEEDRGAQHPGDDRR